MQSTKDKIRKNLLFILAGFYVLGSTEFFLLEALHEISHSISKIEHHLLADHHQDQKEIHHHNKIDSIFKILSSEEQPQPKNEFVTYTTIDKHITPKTFPFEFFETQQVKRFPWYTLSLYESILKVTYPPPKVIS